MAVCGLQGMRNAQRVVERLPGGRGRQNLRVATAVVRLQMRAGPQVIVCRRGESLKAAQGGPPWPSPSRVCRGSFGLRRPVGFRHGK